MQIFFFLSFSYFSLFPIIILFLSVSVSALRLTVTVLLFKGVNTLDQRFDSWVAALNNLYGTIHNLEGQVTSIDGRLSTTEVRYINDNLAQIFSTLINSGGGG